MTRLDLRLYFAGVILLLSFGAFTACSNGSDEPLSLEEYYQRLAALADAYDKSEVAVEREFVQQLEIVESEDEAIQGYRFFFAGILPAFEQFVDGLEGLDPPVDVEDVHKRMIEGAAGALKATRETISELGGEESRVRFEELLQDDERFNEACRESQLIADENDIDVALNCDDDYDVGEYALRAVMSSPEESGGPSKEDYRCDFTTRSIQVGQEAAALLQTTPGGWRFRLTGPRLELLDGPANAQLEQLDAGEWQLTLADLREGDTEFSFVPQEKGEYQVECMVGLSTLVKSNWNVLGD